MFMALFLMSFPPCHCPDVGLLKCIVRVLEGYWCIGHKADMVRGQPNCGCLPDPEDKSECKRCFMRVESMADLPDEIGSINKDKVWSVSNKDKDEDTEGGDKDKDESNKDTEGGDKDKDNMWKTAGTVKIEQTVKGNGQKYTVCSETDQSWLNGTYEVVDNGNKRVNGRRVWRNKQPEKGPQLFLYYCPRRDQVSGFPV
jgi:hypothetical protein